MATAETAIKDSQMDDISEKYETKFQKLFDIPGVPKKVTRLIDHRTNGFCSIIRIFCVQSRTLYLSF